MGAPCSMYNIDSMRKPVMSRSMQRVGAIAALALGCAGVTLSAPDAVGSGGHYVVDDAALVEPGRCAVEAWYSRGGSDAQELVAEPACNLTGNLELTLALSRFRADNGWDTGVGFEAKTLFRTPAIGSWGWGLVGRSDWSDGLGRHESVELYAPVTFMVNDHVMVHLNGGGIIERNDSNALTWGAALDVAVAHDLHLIAEGFGTHRGDTQYQLGLRSIIGSGHVDLGYGWAGSDTSDNWFTVGFAWAF